MIGKRVVLPYKRKCQTKMPNPIGKQDYVYVRFVSELFGPANPQYMGDLDLMDETWRALIERVAKARYDSRHFDRARIGETMF